MKRVLLVTACLFAMFIAAYADAREATVVELEWMIDAKDYDGVKGLLDAGIEDMNEADSSGNTVLHYAVQAGEKDIAGLLVDRGVDINAKNNDGMTALHIAASKGNAGIVKLLLDKGADVTIKNKAGNTPAMAAKNDEIKKLFAKK